MKVLLVNISLDAKLGGGTAERTRHLATHLAKAGSGCAAIAMTGNSWQREFDEHGVQSYITGRIGQHFPIPLLNPWRAWRLVRNADVLHIMGYWNLLSVAMGLLALFARRPYVLCPAGEFASVGAPSTIKKAFHLSVGRWLIKGASGFIAITDLEQGVIAQVADVPQASVPVIGNAVAEPGEQQQAPTVVVPDEPFILFMGRLAPVKGPDYLIQAYLDTPAAQRYPLVMAGPDFGMQQALQAQVGASGLAERIHFIGFLNEAQRTQVYRQAMLLVIPSRSEAMSLVALEAGVVGLPVLLTDTCGFNQVEDVQGGMVVPASADGIASGLQRMLEDEAELKAKGARLKAFILGHYTWSATVQVMLRRFTQLLRSGSMKD
ncbi:glycosyltransferase family 4 protein [Pseudomonas sp. SWRI59]|uniref:glycosyltransferase family 4 protein n=1 Tax=unclassified Pseudomonas TaxID=196821 RepID=UPI0016454DDC|nr:MULTISPECIES: glycosyltransferase family 4 protein [unclassified Pseudomonas]MBC3482377.1 glycosyltransferase family 4 protein [Pseudomonas sp. SWRI77]MBC3500303.1 glycosyltransferase family 4 protein [Pseudomonas sp. SWRI59]MBC3505632.1 glycosyltransferase family 4 protein [Pseudomonas sp. SWRI68]